MALKGDITWTFIEESDTETEDVLVTYPDGKEETITQPKRVYRSETFEDVYIYIKSIQMHTITAFNEKQEIIFYHVAGYETKQDRDADNENFLFFANYQVNEYDHDANLWETCYTALKTNENFSQLENC